MSFIDSISSKNASRIWILTCLLACFNLMTLSLSHRNSHLQFATTKPIHKHQHIHRYYLSSNRHENHRYDLSSNHIENDQQPTTLIMNYSIPAKTNQNNQTHCICPKRAKLYKTKDGQKCLSPQPVEYPEFVDLTCGFMAFLIPTIVALVCKHKEQIGRWRDSRLSLRDEQKDKRKGDNQLNQSELNQLKNSNKVDYSMVKRFVIENRSTKNPFENKLIKSSVFIQQPYPVNLRLKLPKYASSIDINNRMEQMKTSRTPRYATSTDSPRSITKYAYPKDIIPVIRK